MAKGRSKLRAASLVMRNREPVTLWYTRFPGVGTLATSPFTSQKENARLKPLPADDTTGDHHTESIASKPFQKKCAIVWASARNSSSRPVPVTK